MQDIEKYDQRYPIGGASVVEFAASRNAQQAAQQ